MTVLNVAEAQEDQLIADLVAMIRQDARSLMAQEHLSYQGLADRLGVAKSEAWKLVNASPNPRLTTVARLSMALGSRAHISLRPCEEEEQTA